MTLNLLYVLKGWMNRWSKDILVCTEIESSLSAGYLVGLHTVKNKHFSNHRKA